MLDVEFARRLAWDALAAPRHGLARFGTWQLERLAGSSVRGGRVIFLAQASRGRKLAIKVYGEPDRARNQHAALMEVAPLSERVARPCGVMCETGVVMLEWLGRRELTAELGGRDHLERVKELAGWVRAFHREMATGQRVFDPGSWLEYPRRFDVLLAADLRAPERRRRFAQLEERARALQGRFAAVGHVHGDLKPENLMLSARGLVAIDRASPGVGWLVDDVAYLLMGLEKHRFEAAKKQVVWPAGAEAERRIFVDAEVACDGQALLRLALARRALVLWLQALGRRPEGAWTAHLDRRCAEFLGV